MQRAAPGKYFHGSRIRVHCTYMVLSYHNRRFYQNGGTHTNRLTQEVVEFTICAPKCVTLEFFTNTFQRVSQVMVQHGLKLGECTVLIKLLHCLWLFE